jgi:transcription-repair coupling factor (superfamily II helicase)
LIRDAILRELGRNGQVFFVHNRIHDIMKVEKLIRRLVPEARVAMAHGRMTEKELEDRMLSFLDGEADVLLSTAIIGSGLDIPTANTIIVDMADRMGLADLYQLKGRVGRSNARAFAYFLIPGEEAVTEEAKKRLQAIQELSYMGAGFRLAMKDLEIRGAGNLLGQEQSGNIFAVGFDMYIEMLEQAVSELRGEPVRERVRPQIDLRLNAYIPEEFIADAAIRLGVYRRVASARTEEEISSMESEMTDRFGTPPEAFKHLLAVMRLSLAAERLSIADIKQLDGRVRFTFSKDARLTADGILSALNARTGGLRFHEDGFELPVSDDAFAEAEKAIGSLEKAMRVR